MKDFIETMLFFILGSILGRLILIFFYTNDD